MTASIIAVPTSYRTVSRNPPTASSHRFKSCDLNQTNPAIKPTVAMQADVSMVHRPAPNGLARSLRVMLSHPTANPTTGPPTMPATITKNAAGLTFGGPPANAKRKATLAEVRHATMARFFVLLGKRSARTMIHECSEEASVDVEPTGR